MSLILRNTTGSNISLYSLGFTIPAAGTFDLFSENNTPNEIYSDDSIRDHILSGDLVVNLQSSDLTSADSLLLFDTRMTPHNISDTHVATQGANTLQIGAKSYIARGIINVDVISGANQNSYDINFINTAGNTLSTTVLTHFEQHNEVSDSDFSIADNAGIIEATMNVTNDVNLTVNTFTSIKVK